MSPQPSSQLLRSAPYFPVADVEGSASHYERVLGFQREYSGGTPPEFAILSRDGLSVMLRRVPAPDRIIPNEKQGGTWDAFFWVRDAQALYTELRAKGADIVYGPSCRMRMGWKSSRCETAKDTSWDSGSRSMRVPSETPRRANQPESDTR